MRKILSILLVMILTCSTGSIVSAENHYPQEVEKTKTAKVTENNFHLTKAEQEEHKIYQEGLIECIKKEYSENDGDAKPSDVEKALVEYNSDPNTIDPTVEKIEEITGITNSKDLAIRAEELVDEDIIEEYSETFSINENIDVVVAPTAVYLDELEVEYCDDENEDSIVDKMMGIFVDTAKAASSWKTVSVATRRTLFTTIGKRAASVHTGGKIQYNGSKAKYKSDFYGYYHLYFTTYRNLSFDKVKEASGNSYQFYAYGIFYKEAQGISNNSQKISCKVKVSPTGKVTKTYYPKL